MNNEDTQMNTGDISSARIRKLKEDPEIQKYLNNKRNG